ncbi:hypothetical protein TorRG33x02_152450 [Trema orientale]|uniref:Uncharacterized protein n=1 Tax=Trema orientale TaxID=63057 RepID=A0A2P5EU21_TREOI|nr:hypothetical protein TorRG33x02_152450 [Trema orientale]
MDMNSVDEFDGSNTSSINNNTEDQNTSVMISNMNLQPHHLPPRRPRLYRVDTRTRSRGTGTRSSSTSRTTGHRSPYPGAMLEFLRYLDQFGKTVEISGQPAKNPVVSEVEEHRAVRNLTDPDSPLPGSHFKEISE